MLKRAINWLFYCGCKGAYRPSIDWFSVLWCLINVLFAAYAITLVWLLPESYILGDNIGPTLATLVGIYLALVGVHFLWFGAGLARRWMSRGMPSADQCRLHRLLSLRQGRGEERAQ